MNTAPVKANLNGPVKTVRLISLVLMVAGLVVAAAGATTWFTVQSQLADERITVSEDADWFAGEEIDGPLTAYAEAQIIETHALESSGGKMYAELDREDPARQTMMNGYFPLFTSVVSFGIAITLIGYALFLVARRLVAVAPSAN
jgi:hypothetical protein